MSSTCFFCWAANQRVLDPTCNMRFSHGYSPKHLFMNHISGHLVCGSWRGPGDLTEFSTFAKGRADCRMSSLGSGVQKDTMNIRRPNLHGFLWECKFFMDSFTGSRNNLAFS